MINYIRLAVGAILSLFLIGVRAQIATYPISSISHPYVRFYFRAADDNYFIAQGNDSQLYRFDYISGPEPVVVDVIENPTSVANFGNVVAYSGPILIASGSVGYLYTYYCNETCVAGRSIATGGNSDPTSLVVDSAVSSVFYAAYPQFNYINKASVVAIVCAEDIEEGCQIIASIQSFVEDCANSPGGSSGCFKYGYTGYNIKLNGLFGLVIVGFPDANNGRGVVLLYGCIFGECEFIQEIINPNNFTGGALITNSGFGAAVSASYPEEAPYFYITVGVPGAVSGVLDEQDVANLRTGGAYIYACGGLEACEVIYTNDINNYFIDGECEYYNQNYGSFISSFALNSGPNLLINFVSTPDACQGTGGIWINQCVDDSFTFDCEPVFHQASEYGASDNYYGQSLVATNQGYSFFYNTGERGFYSLIMPLNYNVNVAREQIKGVPPFIKDTRGSMKALIKRENAWIKETNIRMGRVKERNLDDEVGLESIKQSFKSKKIRY